MSKIKLNDVTINTKYTNYGTNTDYTNKYNFYKSENNNRTINITIKPSKKVYCGSSGFVVSPYDTRIINIIKSTPERFWHSDNKCWEVAYTYLDDVIKRLNELDYTININNELSEDIIKTNINSKQVIPENYKTKTNPFGQYQTDGIIYGLNHNKFLLNDEQGCISGDCKVTITNSESKASLNIKLKNLYKHFHNKSSRFYNNVNIKCLINGRFRMYKLEDIIHSGIKKTIKIYVNNTYISCTPDHLIYTPRGWVEAYNLKINDVIFTNGNEGCPICGSPDVTTCEYAKYKGYCKTCIYKYLRDGTKYKGDTINKKLNSDGYFVLRGKSLRSRKNYTDGILEHIYVYEQNTGIEVDTSKYVIHHINGIKTDNRFENLQMLTKPEHCKIHADTKTLGLPQFNPNITEIKKGDKIVYFVPQESKIIKIENDIEQDVYDIKLDSSEGIHNFVCNSFIVHNCGKTYQSLNIACIRKLNEGFKHCLVICCVNGNKYNWFEEVYKHTYESAYIIGTRTRKKSGKTYIGSSADKLYDLQHLNDSFFQILNVEALIYSQTEKKLLKNGKVKNITIYPIVEQLKKLIADKDIGYIIVDEIHKIKDSKSQRGKALLDLNCNCVGMTGTPLLNSPVDLYSPLKFIGAETHSLTQFKQHYCVFGGFGGHQIVSYRNLGELQTLLSKNSLRRLRKDEIDLPPKIDIVKYVELAKDQQAIYDEIKEETIDAIKNIDKVQMNFTPLTMFTRLRQCTGNPNILTTKKISNAKFDMLLDIANELKLNNEKFLVYSSWTSVLNDAYKLLAENGFNPALYTGQNTKERENEKAKFKTNKNCMCLCGTIAAMGTGLTLTEATTVIFLDEPWTKGEKGQAEDRAYRIGTKSSVNIITIIAKDTIDERIHDVIHKKGEMSDIIVDNKIDATNNEQLVQMLLM